MQICENPNHFNTALQDDQVNIVVQTQKVRRPTRIRTQLVKLTDLKDFLTKPQVKMEEEMIVEYDPTCLNQTQKDEH